MTLCGLRIKLYYAVLELNYVVRLYGVLYSAFIKILKNSQENPCAGLSCRLEPLERGSGKGLFL